MVWVLVRLGKPIPPTSIYPPRLGINPMPNVGVGGTSASGPPPPAPPITQRVTVASSAGDSLSFTFAALPACCPVAPVLLGISKLTVLAHPTPPRRHPDSAPVYKIAWPVGTA